MMKEIIRIDRDDCVLVAIDYQAKLLPAMEDSKTIEKNTCLLYTSPSPRDISGSRMPSSA